MKEIQLSLRALEKEMRRLEISNQTTNEVGRNLQDLAITLSLEDSTYGDGSLPTPYCPLTKKDLEHLFKASSCRNRSLKDWKSLYWYHVAHHVARDEGETGLMDSEIDIGWTGLSCQCLQQMIYDELVKRIISRAVRSLYCPQVCT